MTVKLYLIRDQLMNYDPQVNKREAAKHYIPASDADIQAMLEHLGCQNFEDLYSHIPKDVRFDSDINIPKSKSSDEIISEMSAIANKNNIRTSFIGDGLKAYKVMDVAGPVLNIRSLTTSYTPYQPERSQGTLMTHWIYQSLLSQLTGFEAVNASMYDRATALFEAIKCSMRIQTKRNKVLVFDSIYPGDREVLDTHAEHTGLEIIWVHGNKFSENGSIGLDELKKAASGIEDDIVSVAFPQINNVGTVAKVDDITDYVHEIGALAIAVIDPLLIATGGLKAPSKYGQEGADIFVAEGQHLAIGPNFGGPGLGIFGIRFNEKCKKFVRATAGRFVGDAKDINGRDCKLIILSTREQHIKREKANSNICSNEAYIATVCGAAILNRGDKGLQESVEVSRKLALRAAEVLSSFKGVELAFPEAAFMNEFTLKIDSSVSALIAKGLESDLQIGVNVSDRIEKDSDKYLMLCFTDLHSEKEIEVLEAFFANNFEKDSNNFKPIDLPACQLREGEVGIAHYSAKEIEDYYTTLGTQNVSPDNAIYPLGSCTMKYNPYLNDYVAAFDGFANAHPQAPESDVQGCLEVIYETQEYFKAITGLPGVTTQPLAGAQGELVGVKLFQAYHQDRGEKRDIILIPKTAHGTNPATAAVAGLVTKKFNGIVEIESTIDGEMDFDRLKECVAEYGERILGVMVTNPNTSGIFETQFAAMSELIHSVGGLVYMDGANMNAIAAWVDLGKMGVDAVHNNTHKTWSIPHGGGGPGDAFVAVSEKLIPFLPGIQSIKNSDGQFEIAHAPKSIGSFHRHEGNFGHKVRCLTYLKALGHDGVKRMAAVAVLSARYLFSRLEDKFCVLPTGNKRDKVMHEFILTLPQSTFDKIVEAGIPKALVISRVGKLFLDFGFHAPTVAWPEMYGLMIEPTESYTKEELDRFADAVLALFDLIDENPRVLLTAPHFTPIDRVDDVPANKKPVMAEIITELPEVLPNRFDLDKIWAMDIPTVKETILKAHEDAKI